MGLSTHLEQLLFYGCDMNSRIVGSGNTALHVAAINDQSECARILLLRGCDTSIVNNSHQNAYQVAVISGNMSLSEMINNHKAENVVPYRDKPRFNPARRPQSNYDTISRSKVSDLNGTNGQAQIGRSLSPSLSLNTNNTTASSGVCCDQDEHDAGNKLMKAHDDGEDEDEEEDEEDDEDEEERPEGTNESSESEGSAKFLPGMTVKASSDYNSGDPSHLQLRRNDLVQLMQSTHTPPTIASQKLLLGRRCADNQEGFFPACCVEKIKPHRNRSSIGDGDEQGRVEGRRDLKLKNQSIQSATLPTRGRRGARKCLLDKGVTKNQYQERTVTLHRGSKGFGFVLRGAKDSSPILNRQLMQQGGQSVPLIGLQYFDEIENGGVADAAGLKRGDFLLGVNDVDVRHMSHENAVQLIRQSGDKVTMTIATTVPKPLVSILKKKKSKTGATNNGTMTTTASTTSTATVGTEVISSSQSQTHMSQSAYGSLNKSKAPPPAPPKRDPSTTLSTISRVRARSLVVPSEVRSAHNKTMMLMGDVTNPNNNKNNQDETNRCSSPESVGSTSKQTDGKATSNRSQSNRRLSSYESNDFKSSKVCQFLYL